MTRRTGDVLLELPEGPLLLLYALLLLLLGAAVAVLDRDLGLTGGENRGIVTRTRYQ